MLEGKLRERLDRMIFGGLRTLLERRVGVASEGGCDECKVFNDVGVILEYP